MRYSISHSVFDRFVCRLFFGLCCSLITLYAKGWKSQCHLLGALPDSDIYVNIETHRKAIQLPNVKIFRYIGAINFASSNTFKRSLYKSVDSTLLRRRSTVHQKTLNNADEVRKLQAHALIVDLSAVTHLDVAGCKTLVEIQTDMLLSNTVLYLTSPNDDVFEALKRAELLSIGEFMVLPTIQDAVFYFKGSVTESA